jgi:ribosome maturation factor RimP
MSTEEKKIQIELLLEGIMVNEPEYFVVNSRVKPTNNFKIFIDGDNGITIEKCVQINRKLYKLIEEAGYFPEGDFSLEVSSPGIEEPLKIFRQYKKNIGRFVEVVLSDETKKEGKMIEVDETGITIEFTEGKGKKAITQQLVIPFSNIKTTTVQIKF